MRASVAVLGSPADAASVVAFGAGQSATVNSRPWFKLVSCDCSTDVSGSVSFGMLESASIFMVWGSLSLLLLFGVAVERKVLIVRFVKGLCAS
jgi:hypothetical protein